VFGFGVWVGVLGGSFDWVGVVDCWCVWDVNCGRGFGVLVHMYRTDEKGEEQEKKRKRGCKRERERERVKKFEESPTSLSLSHQ
jgi:hypothetical protein